MWGVFDGFSRGSGMASPVKLKCVKIAFYGCICFQAFICLILIFHFSFMAEDRLLFGNLFQRRIDAGVEPCVTHENLSENALNVFHYGERIGIPRSLQFPPLQILFPILCIS